MANIIFAMPVHHYDSYRDFWRLVELSGFPTIRVDEIDLTQPGVYITAPMNGDYKEYIAGQIEKQVTSGQYRAAHLILWNLERPAGSGSVGQYAKDCYDWFYGRLVDEVWVSDPQLADETMLRYVILGSHPGLGEISNEKEYDFTHMSVEIPRRVQIYKHFDNGQIGANCWPPERDEVLKKSRFALNVHQDNHPFCEPLRIALFAAYGLPVISETIRNGFPYNEGIYQLAYHDIVPQLRKILSDDYGKWQEMGMKLHQRMCHDFQFGNVVRQAVEQSTGGWR